MIFPAMRTGRLNIISGVMARELRRQFGKVGGVSYVDGDAHREDHPVQGCVASACESARLLLNSRSRNSPGRQRFRAGRN
jgi:hypothetical protein